MRDRHIHVSTHYRKAFARYLKINKLGIKERFSRLDKRS